MTAFGAMNERSRKQWLIDHENSDRRWNMAVFGMRMGLLRAYVWTEGAAGLAQRAADAQHLVGYMFRVVALDERFTFAGTAEELQRLMTFEAESQASIVLETVGTNPHSNVFECRIENQSNGKPCTIRVNDPSLDSSGKRETIDPEQFNL